MRRKYNKSNLEEILSENELTEIFTDKAKAYLSIRKFHNTEVVLYDKDELTVLSIVIEGKLKVVPSSMEGKNTLVDFIEKGAILGEIEYFGEGQNIHTVVACEETVLLDIPFRIIEEELKNYPPFLLFICNRLSEKLCSLSLTHSKQLLMSTKVQLCKYITETSLEHESDLIPIKYTELAQWIGKSDRHIRRVVVELIEEKLIRKEGRGYIRILNVEGLEQIIKEV